MGERYNSIRREDDPMNRWSQPSKEYPIGYDLDQVKDLIAADKKNPPKHNGEAEDDIEPQVVEYAIVKSGLP